MIDMDTYLELDDLVVDFCYEHNISNTDRIAYLERLVDWYRWLYSERTDGSGMGHVDSNENSTK